MADEFLDGRRRALEEAFFAKQNDALLRRLREKRDTEGHVADKALDGLAGLNASNDTLAALSLIPLVAVAWADGSVDEKEKAAILSAAADQGIHKDGASYEMLNQWLTERPAPDLVDRWKAYIGAKRSELDPAARQAIEREVLDRARTVAEAAGGILGFGRKVSPAEEAVLNQFREALA